MMVVHIMLGAGIDSDHNLLVARIYTRLKKIVNFKKRKTNMGYSEVIS
jgi:hypothetical protein